MRLALQLLTFNRPETLLLLLCSLETQTDRDWTLYVLDNSTDASKAVEIKQIVDETSTRLPIIFERSSENIGFDGGHQHLYQQHNADYLMCLNDDAFLQPDFIQQLSACLDQHPMVAAVSGKILRWDFDAQGKVVKSDIVDSLGLKKMPWHEVRDIGAGKRDTQSLKHSSTVFGVSGCLPMYRRTAVGAQLFDPSYFMYKEDVDLSYRFAKTGWTAMIVPTAVAYHRRTFSAQARKATIPFLIQWLSYRNHWRNLKKHLTWKDWMTNGWMIIPYEVAKCLYLCYKYPRAFLPAVWKELV